MILMHHLWHWLQQPTTLSGLSMLTGSGMATFTGTVSSDLGRSILEAAHPPLFHLTETFQ